MQSAKEILLRKGKERVPSRAQEAQEIGGICRNFSITVWKRRRGLSGRENRSKFQQPTGSFEIEEKKA